MIAAEVHGADEVRVSRFDSSGLNLWNHYADDLEGHLEWSFSPRDESGLLFMAGWADPNTLAVSRIDSSSEIDSVEIDSSFRTLQRDQLTGIGDIAYVVTGLAGTSGLPHLYSVNVTDSEYVQIGAVHYPYHTRLDGYHLADELGESASIVTVGTVPSTFLSGERSYISKFGIGGTRHWARELSGEGSFALGVVLGSQAIYAVSAGTFGAFSSAPLYVEAMDPAGNSLWVEELEEGGYSLNGISYDGNELLFFGRNEHGDMGRVAGFLYVMDDSGNVLLESHYSSAFTNETVDAIRHDDGIISLVAINEDVSHEPTHCIAIRQDADGQSIWETPLGSEYERSNCSNILKLEENRILVSSMAGSVGGLNGFIWEIDVDDGNIINTQMFAPESGSSISNLTLDLAGDCVLVAMAEVGNSESSDTKSVKCLDRQLAQRWEILDSASGAVENLSITIGKQSAAVGFAVSSDDDSICMELIQFDFSGQEVSQPWTPADHCGPSSMLILDQTSDDFVLGGYTGTAPENGLDAISISSFSDVILRNGFE